jgi:hypothetical protein
MAYPNNPRPSRRAYLLLTCGAAALLAGCQQDEIQRYQVARTETPKPAMPAMPAAPAGVKGEARMLAAILPHGDRSWFVKLVGPPDAVAAHAEAFDKFVRSLRFTQSPDRPLTWTVPEGWREEPGKGFRYATLRMGPRDAELELTVSSAGGSMLENLNRWRGQIGLKPIAAGELSQAVKDVPVNGIEAKVIDMTGPGASGAPGKRM